MSEAPFDLPPELVQLSDPLDGGRVHVWYVNLVPGGVMRSLCGHRPAYQSQLTDPDGQEVHDVCRLMASALAEPTRDLHWSL